MKRSEQLITFANGEQAVLTDPTDCGLFSTGIIRRSDGFVRCVFIDAAGQPHADPWLAPKYPRLSAARV